MNNITFKPVAPRVAIIIVSWNNKDILPDCIKSVQNQTYQHIDTYIIDNDSKDYTAEFVSTNYPGITLINGGSNLGFAKGNNVAIKQAIKTKNDYQYFVLLNTDARLRPDWVEKVVEFAERKPTGAVFQSITLDYYDTNIIDSTHIYISRAGQGTQGNWREPFVGEKGPLRVFGVNAAAALISRRFIDAQPFSGVFDEKMFMYLEDVDLSARATVMGWENYLVPGTEAYHMGSASSGKNPGFSIYMTFRNNSAMLIKNLPISVLVTILPRLIKGDYETFKHLWWLGKRRAAFKVAKGRLVGLLRLPLYIPDIIKMSRHRNIDKRYLKALFEKGYL